MTYFFNFAKFNVNLEKICHADKSVFVTEKRVAQSFKSVLLCCVKLTLAYFCVNLKKNEIILMNKEGGRFGFCIKRSFSFITKNVKADCW